MFGKLHCLLLVLFLTAFEVSAEPTFPELSGRIVDQADLLSPSEESEISKTLAEHEQRTDNQIVVVTLRSLGGYEIADYGYQLGRHWGIGQAERNNGALLIVVPDERKVRIEVGYGLEGELTDARSHQIIQQDILPRFKAGDFPGGIRAGVRAIIATIEGERVDRPVATPSSQPTSKGKLEVVPVIIMGAFFFLREILSGLLGGRVIASFVSGTIGGLIAWSFTRMLWVGIWAGIVLTLIGLFAGGPRGPGGRGRRTFGYSGGMIGGGGFSGGGGSFGGGGASGRW